MEPSLLFVNKHRPRRQADGLFVNCRYSCADVIYLLLVIVYTSCQTAIVVCVKNLLLQQLY
jgi:hypothetical protein